MPQLRDLIRSKAVVRELEEMAGYKRTFMRVVRPFAAHDMLKRKTIILNPGWYEVERAKSPYGRSQRPYRRKTPSVFSGPRPQWFVLKETPQVGEKIQTWLAAGTLEELSPKEYPPPP